MSFLERLPPYRGTRRWRFHPYPNPRRTDGITRTDDTTNPFSLPPLYSVSRLPGPTVAFILVHPLQRVFINRGFYVLVLDVYADRLILNVIYPPIEET